MATGGQTFLSLNNSRRQRGLHSNHHHHNSHAFHHHHHNANPFQNQFLNPLTRAYHHLTATIPNATQPHHFHNTFHNAKTDLNEDDSLSSISMLSTEQTKRKVRWILSLGLLLPALAAIIGVVSWAVSAEVVLGVQREQALKNQQEFHNNHGPDDFLLDQLETRKLSFNSDHLNLGKQRILNRNVFGERINANVKTLASTESKDNLIPSSRSGSNVGNEDLVNVNGLNQDPKLISKLVPTIVKETESNEKTIEEIDLKSKNSVENQNLQMNTAKTDSNKLAAILNRDKIPMKLSTNQTELNEEKNEENDLNEENNSTANDNTDEDKVPDEKFNGEEDEKPSADDNSPTNGETTRQPDSINEQLDNGKSNNDEKVNIEEKSNNNGEKSNNNEEKLNNNEEKSNNNEEKSSDENDESSTSTPSITTTKMQTTSSTATTSDDGKNVEVRTTTKQIIYNQQSEQDDQKSTTSAVINGKKSAGAQVAEVIDKLVAQRKGQGSPHIVVVAPFRLRNGNKKLTVTEGDVHGIPQFGTRSISAHNLAGFLGNKGTTERKIATTISTTPSTTTTEEVKSASADDEMKNEKTNEESKSDENTDVENKEVEIKEEKSDSVESENNKENDESKSSDNDDEADEDEDTTTAKPVLINRIREAVRNQFKNEKQLTDKVENQKRTNKSNEKMNPNESTKHNDKEEQPIRPRTRKTSPRKSTGSLIKINHESSKNDSADSFEDSIRRIDDELPEKLISLDLTKDEDFFLKGGFLKKTTSLEKAFKELEKSKNLKYQGHEYTHQTKEHESYYGSSSNNRKQTVKPIIDLHQITKPSASPPPQPQINQHFFVNTQNSQQSPANRNNNNNDNNQNKNQMNFNKQFMNNQPQLSKFTNQDHRSSKESFNNKNQKIMNNGQRMFNKGSAPAPASYSYQTQNRKHHQSANQQQQMPHSTNNNNNMNSNSQNNNNNFAVQQNQQQKQILNQLLQANAVSTNQIQRSMNVNSGMNINQLNHLKIPQNQRSIHIPKQQLIQHIQMLSNLNSKHTFPTAQSPQQILNNQQSQNQPQFIDLSQNTMGPLPTMGPDQFVELSQMMDGKMSPTALAAAANAHYAVQEQNIRNLQNLQGMESANSNFQLDPNNNHLMNVQPTKPQIHYADQPILNSNAGFFTDASNINPTNQPPPSSNNNNLQTAESVGHSQHSPSSNLLSVGDSSNSAMINFNMKEPPHPEKGLKVAFGSGPSSGGAQLITNPLGIFKSIFLPLLPKPRMNLNGKVVFGVVLDTSLKKPAPKHPVIVVPASHKPHHFFG